MAMPTAGENVLLVPQASAWLMNPHDARNVVGQPTSSVDALVGERWEQPSWTTYTSTLLRKGFGLLVVREGVLAEGPTWWDSGD